MRQVLLVRFGEVHLKGLNRPYFLKKLTDNVKRAVKPLGGKAWLSDSRIYVSDCPDMDACVEAVRRVFGVYSVNPAWEMDKNYDQIAAKVAEITRGLTGTFKVLARRSDKHFPIDSQQLNCDLGGVILANNPNLTVDVHHPQHKVGVEIRDHAYVYCTEIHAVGGMPMGTGGKALLLLSGGIDSPVAGFNLMKRGVALDAIHFFSFPYTSERAKEKVIDLARILCSYQGGMRVHVVSFTEIQMQIHEKCPEAYGTLITRRFMMRIANEIARRIHAQALVTGESLGQVASQTMEALGCTDEVTDMPVFRPLIGLDKSEIIEQAIKIDTYETSILPFEDCCTVFTPRHPATKPRKDEIARAEAALDIDKLVSEAIDGQEIIQL